LNIEEAGNEPALVFFCLRLYVLIRFWVRKVKDRSRRDQT